MTPGRIAILVADPYGTDPPFEAAGWLEAAITAVDNHTTDPAVYVVASPNDRHSRGARLRSAFDTACADGADHVVMMELGVLPIDDSWLQQLIDQINGGIAVAGIWGIDEDARRLTSCVCTAAQFVDSHAIDFDTSSSPLSAVVDAAEAAGASVRNLQRSNRYELHGFPGALYGDILYDHGVESWLRSDDETDERHRQRTLAADLALHHREDFVEWMRGDRITGRIVFVLGMHRSGTSALTACLEQCGLFLGRTFRTPLPDHPTGNFERPDATSINDQLLADVGASWQHPPSDASVGGGGAAISAVIDELASNAPAGVKDPRLLFTLDAWLASVDRPGLIGSFRHPAEVVQSLWQRDRIAPADGYRLWKAYNSRLVELHRSCEFPLIEFNPLDRLDYGRRVAGAAAELGLCPRIHAVLDVVAEPAKAPPTVEESTVPADVSAVWEYLREHRFEDPLPQDSFVGLALAWESTQTSVTVTARGMRAVRWPYRLGRRIPRSARRQLWRLWCKVVGTPQPR